MDLKFELVPPPHNTMSAVSIFLTYVLAGLVMITPLRLALHSMHAANDQLRVKLLHHRVAQEELRLHERIVSQMREDVVYMDRKGQILYVNTSFERVTGYTREECPDILAGKICPVCAHSRSAVQIELVARNPRYFGSQKCFSTGW